MAPHRKIQRKLLLVKLLQNARRMRKQMQQKTLSLLTVSECYYWRVFIAALLISSEKTADRFLVFLFILFFMSI